MYMNNARSETSTNRCAPSITRKRKVSTSSPYDKCTTGYGSLCRASLNNYESHNVTSLASLESTPMRKIHTSTFLTDNDGVHSKPQEKSSMSEDDFLNILEKELMQQSAEPAIEMDEAPADVKSPSTPNQSDSIASIHETARKTTHVSRNQISNDPTSFIMKTLTSSIRSISANYLQQVSTLNFETIKRQTEECLQSIKSYINREDKEFFGEEKYLVASVSMQILNRYENVLESLGVTDTSTHDLDLMEEWIHIFYACDYKEQIYDLYEKIKSEILLKGDPSECNVISEENEVDKEVIVPKEGEEISDDSFAEIVDSGKFTSSRVEDRDLDLIDIVPEFKNVETYYKIIQTLSHVSRTEYIAFILNYLVENNLGMNTETFRILIETCERDGATDVAMGYFDKMHQNDIAPNAAIIASLLKVFISAKDEQFLDIYKSFMEYNKVTESEATHLEKILLQGLTDVVHDFTTTLSILDHLESKGRKITQDDYYTLFDAVYKFGSKLDAIQVYEHMSKRNVPCNLQICEKLCLTYAKHGDPKTFQIYHVLNQKYGFNDKKTMGIFNAFIQVASIHHNHAKVKQLMNQMRLNGMRPNVQSHLHYGASLYHTNWRSKMEASLQAARDPQQMVSKVPEDELPFLDDEEGLQILTQDSDLTMDTDIDIMAETWESIELEIENDDEQAKKTDITAMNQELKRELETILGRKSFKDLLTQAHEEYQQDVSGFQRVPDTSEELLADGPHEISFDEDFVPTSVSDLFDSMDYERMHTTKNIVDHQLLSFLTRRAEESIIKNQQGNESLKESNQKENEESTQEGEKQTKVINSDIKERQETV